MSVSLFVLRFLPKNLLSAVSGKLAAIRLPKSLNVRLLRWFEARYGVSAEEATKPLESYRSLSEFFVRDLKPGLRPIGPGVVSPVDGTISELGEIRNGLLLQVKGRDYPVAELLADPALAERFEGGFFATFYLAPGDYHHIHSPVDGFLIGFRAVPGTLWPVNAASVREIPKLFCQNERVISLLDSRDFGVLAVVKVGATNVGSIALSYDSFVANRSPLLKLFGLHPVLASGVEGEPSVEVETRTRQEYFRKEYREKIPIARGERLATFRLGSTVVLLFERGKFVPGPRCRTGKIRFGENLGASSEL